MSLSDYRKKRDFQKTPEPDPTAVRRAPLTGARFVVHRHETTQPFSDPAWIFEAAFEGARALATKKCDALALRAAETGERIETSLVDVRAGLTALRAENVVIDGVLVLVVAEDTQRPSAELVQRALAAEGGEEVQFYAFDLIYFDEWHIGKLRLLERKKLLEAILPQSRAVLYVDHVVGEGKELCRVVAGAGLPGVVAKEAASRYRGGLSKRWRRIEVETAGRSTEGVHDIL